MTDLKECIACKREKFKKENPTAMVAMNGISHTCDQYNIEYLIYMPPKDIQESPKALNASIGVKFCRDTYIAQYLLDKWNIKYEESELEDGPWGRGLRIKKND
jgi:hypothetical protein